MEETGERDYYPVAGYRSKNVAVVEEPVEDIVVTETHMSAGIEEAG